MSDLFNQNKTKYVIDTSAFIDLKRMYPQDIFQSLWMKFQESLEENVIISHIEVHNELQTKDDELARWLKPMKKYFLEDGMLEESKLITTIGIKYENFINKPKKFYADPWIIAQAKFKNLTIITQESKRDDRERIPKIAKEMFNIECLSLFELMRVERWVF
jgi:predicted nucleic acid-binding protein